MYRITAIAAAVTLAACVPLSPVIKPDRVFTKGEREAAAARIEWAGHCMEDIERSTNGSVTDLTIKLCADARSEMVPLQTAIHRSYEAEAAQMPACVNEWHIDSDIFESNHLVPDEPGARGWLLMTAVVAPKPSDSTMECLSQVCAWRRQWGPNVWTREFCKSPKGTRTAKSD